MARHFKNRGILPAVLYVRGNFSPGLKIKVCLCCSLIIFCHLQLNGKEDSCLILSTHNVLLTVLVPTIHIERDIIGSSVKLKSVINEANLTTYLTTYQYAHSFLIRASGFKQIAVHSFLVNLVY